jgi:hypothetical protein
MAQRRRRKISWIRRFVIYLFVPLTVWLMAFLVWFYWFDLREFFVKDQTAKNRSKAARQIDKSDKAERPAAKRSPEKIFDDERKKLDDIIKRQE